MKPKTFTLMPGDVCLAFEGDKLKTILGSCIAVILSDPLRTMGAMCHIVHVSPPKTGDEGNTAYGLAAMRRMFDRLHSAGIAPQRCEAYVYGGSHLLGLIPLQRHVGTTNTEWVLDFLADNNIPMVACDVGGTGYRKLSWTPGPDPPQVTTVPIQPGDCHGC